MLNYSLDEVGACDDGIDVNCSDGGGGGGGGWIENSKFEGIDVFESSG